MDTDCFAFVHCIEEIVWGTTENVNAAGSWSMWDSQDACGWGTGEGH